MTAALRGHGGSHRETFGARPRSSTKTSPLLAGIHSRSHRHLERGWEQCVFMRRKQRTLALGQRAVGHRSHQEEQVSHRFDTITYHFYSFTLCIKCFHLFEWPIFFAPRGHYTLYLLPDRLFPYFLLGLCLLTFQLPAERSPPNLITQKGYFTLIDLQMLKNPCIPGINPT